MDRSMFDWLDRLAKPQPRTWKDTGVECIIGLVLAMCCMVFATGLASIASCATGKVVELRLKDREQERSE